MESNKEVKRPKQDVIEAQDLEAVNKNLRNEVLAKPSDDANTAIRYNKPMGEERNLELSYTNERRAQEPDPQTFSNPYSKISGELLYNELLGYRGQLSDAEIYAHFENYIIANKDNPASIISATSAFLDKFNESYDPEKNHQPIADTPQETFMKFLNSNGQPVKGAVCTTMAGFFKDLFDKHGIPATVAVGTSKGEGHAVLLYQLENGKYVVNNYGDSMVVTADNPKVALEAFFKNSPDVKSNGYVQVLDDNNNTYSMYGLRDTGAFGKEIDKNSHILEGPFDDKFKDKSSFNVSSTDSNIGRTIRVDDVTVNKSDNSREQTTISIESKRNGSTPLFDSSESIGAKYETINDKTSDDGKKTIGTGIKGIFSHTKGYFNSTDQDAVKSQDIGTFSLGVVGSVKEKAVETSDGRRTTSVGAEASLDGTLTVSHLNYEDATGVYGGIGGDASARVRVGIENEQNNGSISHKEYAYGGPFVRVNPDNVGQFNNIRFEPGLEFGAGASIEWNPKENTSVGAYVKGATAYNNIFQQEAASAGVRASHQSGNNTKYYGELDYTHNTEKMKNSSLFKEPMVNESTIRAEVGVEKNDNKLSLGYYNTKGTTNDVGWKIGYTRLF